GLSRRDAFGKIERGTRLRFQQQPAAEGRHPECEGERKSDIRLQIQGRHAVGAEDQRRPEDPAAAFGQPMRVSPPEDAENQALKEDAAGDRFAAAERRAGLRLGGQKLGFGAGGQGGSLLLITNASPLRGGASLGITGAPAESSSGPDGPWRA